MDMSNAAKKFNKGQTVFYVFSGTVAECTVESWGKVQGTLRAKNGEMMKRSVLMKKCDYKPVKGFAETVFATKEEAEAFSA